MKSRIGKWIVASLVFAIAGGASAQSPLSQQIEIKLPKGANGMQPDLRLVYAPEGTNDIVGVGWRLTGLPYITRVNNGSGVKFAGSDSYAHSELGVLVKQQLDGSYRTKRESFTKLVSSGVCGDGPCTWSAYSADGMRFDFGTTTGSTLMPLMGGCVSYWALSQVTDRFGNSYDITYTRDATNGRTYPATITYTKGPGLTTYRTVQFAYEARTDADPGYPDGVFRQTMKRLKWVSVYSAGSLVRKYRLDYGAGVATGRSQLTTVQEYGSNGNDTSCAGLPAPAACALPAQTFTYAAQANAFVSTAWGNAGNGQDYGRYQFADFNGDGKTDVLFIGGDAHLAVTLSSGTGFAKPQDWGTFGNGAASELPRYRLGDFNGDGKTDVLFIGGDARLWLALSTGTGFTLAQEWATFGNGAASELCRYQFADFNGDEKTDVLFVGGHNPGDMLVSLSTGTRFADYQDWGDFGNGLDVLRYRVGDFNGDGKTDLLFIGGNSDLWLAMSSGTGFGAPQNWKAFGNGLYSELARYQLGDFNGDGSTDVLFIGGDAHLSVALSTGVAFAFPTDWITLGNGAASELVRYHFADFNGDRKTDVLFVGGHATGDVLVSLSTGSTFAPCATWTNYGNGYDPGRYRVGDFDGDGKADSLFIGGEVNAAATLQVAVSQGKDSLLTRIDNGLGGTVYVSYAQAGQLPGVIDPTSTGPGVANAAARWLVTAVTSTDGRGGSYAMQYAYGDGRRWPGAIPERRDLGFAWTKAVDAQTSQYAITWFNQSAGLEGLTKENAAYDGLGRLSKRAVSSFDLIYPSAGTELPRERTASIYIYEKGVLAFSRSTVTDYDAFGNPTVKTQTADGLPTVVITFTWDNDATNWLLRRLARTTTAAVGKTYSDSLNVWTGASVTEKRDWLDTDNDGLVDASDAILVTAIGYDANGNLASVTQPDAGDGLLRRTVNEFDSTFRANKSRIVNALQQETLWTYTSSGLVETAEDLNHEVTTTTYDVFGREKTRSTPGGGFVEYAYDAIGDPNSQHKTVTTKVDSNRSLWRSEYFDGMGFTYGVTSSGECAQWLVTDFEKDAAGRPYRTSQPHCYGAPQTWTTTSYDAAGRASSVVTPDGKATTYAYETSYSQVTDPVGGVTKKYTNAKGWLTKVVDTAGNSTTYGYDPLGRMTSVTLPNAISSLATWDSLGRKTSLRADAALGTTGYTYDAAGNLLTLTQGGKVTTFTYDALNRVIQKAPQGDTVVYFVYDETDVTYGIGRLTSVSDAAGTARYAYTPTGQVAGIRRIVDGRSFSLSNTYDLGGRQTGLSYPDGSLAAYRYSDGGTLAELTLTDGTNPTGPKTIAAWANPDAAGRPATVAYGNGIVTTYAYDVMGHVTSLETVRGVDVLQDLTYDWYSRSGTAGLNVGSITDNRVIKTIAGVNTDETQTYTYDALSRLTQAVGVWGTKNYSYDGLGNLTTFGGLVNRTLYYSGQQLTSGTQLSGVTYDAAGNMLTKTLDGVSWAYTWTAEGRLASVTQNGLATAQMVYDADGQRAKKVFAPASGAAVTTTYIGKEYELRSFSNGALERHTLHLFANGQLVASVTKEGNIATAMRDGGESRVQRALGGMYDVRSAKGAVKAAGHALLGLAYSPAVVRWTGPTLLLVVSAALLLVFIRALLSQRYRRSVGLQVRFAALTLLVAFASAACSGGTHPEGRSVLSPRNGGDELIAGDTKGGLPAGTIFYHRNHVNSSAVVTRLDGTEAMRAVYLPFGEISQANSTGSDVTTVKFTGQELDEETGLYYYGARYMDPALGRFISADTVVPAWMDAQAHNRYAYVRNNPIVYTDPTGHSWFSAKAWRVIATGVLIAAAIVGSIVAPPVFLPILIGMGLGAAAGGFSAWKANGGGRIDWDSFSKGLLAGTIAGGIAGFATGPVGLGGLQLGGFWGSVASGAMIGAVNGAAMGVAAGYQGGIGGWKDTFWQTVAVGALSGAVTGAVLGGLSYGRSVQELPEAKIHKAFEIQPAVGNLPAAPVPASSPTIAANGPWEHIGAFLRGSTGYAKGVGLTVMNNLLIEPVARGAGSMLLAGAASAFSEEPFDIPKVSLSFSF